MAPDSDTLHHVAFQLAPCHAECNVPSAKNTMLPARLATLSEKKLRHEHDPASMMHVMHVLNGNDVENICTSPGGSKLRPYVTFQNKIRVVYVRYRKITCA